MQKIDNREPVTIDDDKLLAELDEEEAKTEVESDEEIEKINKKLEEVEEVEEPVIQKQPEKQIIDYEAKFKASTQEAMIMKAKLDAIEAEKNKPIEIDEAYMKANYPDWDELTTTEQKILTKNEKLEQEIKDIRSKTNEFNNDRKWESQISEMVENPELIEQFPSLKGKEEQFKRFCTKPTRKGLPVDTLAAAFLYEFKEEKPTRTIFSEGSSGPDKKPVTKGITAEEASLLRKNNNAKYMELLKAGKIDLLSDL